MFVWVGVVREYVLQRRLHTVALNCSCGDHLASIHALHQYVYTSYLRVRETSSLSDCTEFTDQSLIMRMMSNTQSYHK